MANALKLLSQETLPNTDSIIAVVEKYAVLKPHLEAHIMAVESAQKSVPAEDLAAASAPPGQRTVSAKLIESNRRVAELGRKTCTVVLPKPLTRAHLPTKVTPALAAIIMDLGVLFDPTKAAPKSE